ARRLGRVLLALSRRHLAGDERAFLLLPLEFLEGQTALLFTPFSGGSHKENLPVRVVAKGRSWHASAPVRSRLVISPRMYSRVATVALAALALIVLTGAAVRMTGSGLGCPDWPKCYGRTVAPLESHAIIEYTNRLLSGFVGVAVILAGVLAWFRRPFRWHLAFFGG